MGILTTKKRRRAEIYKAARWGVAFKTAASFGSCLPPGWTWVNGAIDGDPWAQGGLRAMVEAASMIGDPALARSLPTGLVEKLHDLQERRSVSKEEVRSVHDEATSLIRGRIYALATRVAHSYSKRVAEAILDPQDRKLAEVDPLGQGAPFRLVFNWIQRRLRCTQDEIRRQPEASWPPSTTFDHIMAALDDIEAELTAACDEPGGMRLHVPAAETCMVAEDEPSEPSEPQIVREMAYEMDEYLIRLTSDVARVEDEPAEASEPHVIVHNSPETVADPIPLTSDVTTDSPLVSMALEAYVDLSSLGDDLQRGVIQPDGPPQDEVPEVPSSQDVQLVEGRQTAIVQVSDPLGFEEVRLAVHGLKGTCFGCVLEDGDLPSQGWLWTNRTIDAEPWMNGDEHGHMLRVAQLCSDDGGRADFVCDLVERLRDVEGGGSWVPAIVAALHDDLTAFIRVLIDEVAGSLLGGTRVEVDGNDDPVALRKSFSRVCAELRAEHQERLLAFEFEGQGLSPLEAFEHVIDALDALKCRARRYPSVPETAVSSSHHG